MCTSLIDNRSEMPLCISQRRIPMYRFLIESLRNIDDEGVALQFVQLCRDRNNAKNIIDVLYCSLAAATQFGGVSEVGINAEIKERTQSSQRFNFLFIHSFAISADSQRLCVIILFLDY